MNSLEIKSRKEIHDRRGLAMTHGGLGRLYNDFTNPPDIPKARYHYKEDLKYSEDVGDISGQSQMYSRLGGCDVFEAEMLAGQGNPEKEKKKLADALGHYKMAHTFAEKAASTLDAFFALTGMLKVSRRLDSNDDFEQAGKALLALARKNEKPIPQFLAKVIHEILDTDPAPSAPSSWITDLREHTRKVCGK